MELLLLRVREGSWVVWTTLQKAKYVLQEDSRRAYAVLVILQIVQRTLDAKGLVENEELRLK